jgi:predicted metal-dependent hydrolase
VRESKKINQSVTIAGCLFHFTAVVDNWVLKKESCSEE